MTYFITFFFFMSLLLLFKEKKTKKRRKRYSNKPSKLKAHKQNCLRSILKTISKIKIVPGSNISSQILVEKQKQTSKRRRKKKKLLSSSKINVIYLCINVCTSFDLLLCKKKSSLINCQMTTNKCPRFSFQK